MQHLTFDANLSDVLHLMYSANMELHPNRKLTYNGYVEGILSDYVVRRFGCVPSIAELEAALAKKKNGVK